MKLKDTFIKHTNILIYMKDNADTSLRLKDDTKLKLTLLKLRRRYKSLDVTLNKMLDIIKKYKIEGEME